jgi:GxxExxY protein
MLEQEGYDLVGAALEVYNTLGAGFLEEVYQESIEVELADRGIPYSPQQELRIHYRNRLLQSRYFPDLIVYDAIIVELKAVKELAPEHEAQLLNYLKATGMRVGYLLNFGHPGKLEWKRMIMNHS